MPKPIITVPKILLQAKGAMKQSSNHVSRPRRRSTSPSAAADVPRNIPKGHLAVYVGNGRKMNRFVIPITYLTHPLFQDLLHKAEEEFGFEHPMGGLTLPCTEDHFLYLLSHLSGH